MSNPDIGEQAISKAAEVGMKSQLDEVEDLDVDIRANPGGVVQGELDSVEVEGKGLVMKKDLRAEKLDLKTDGVAIAPLSAAFGHIELKRPTQADAHVLLMEQDIERAFNSEYIQKKLRGLTLDLEGQQTQVDIRNVTFHLPGNQRVALGSEVLMVQEGTRQKIAFEATPVISEDGQSVVLEDIQYGDQAEISPQLTQALIASTAELLDLRNFELQGMHFTLNHLQTQQGQLTLEAKAYIESFPG